MIAMSTKPAYMMEQLVDKAYTAILQTSLYETPCAEFEGMDPNNQTYATLKEHMLQVFELRLQIDTAGGQNTAYNVTHPSTDDDSVGTIPKSIQNMQMANNAAAHTINENMLTSTR